ncbi:hypothetical protein K491DRAFT_713172 [Lophiostoma macrostomum CBS 122681]|uniref:Uncharacterized protein n=1 Tax=Lophiostoma macrostomum CBS 122681 TaxID=1314788 RepID=A0A6A6TIA5_9PLEO|nr:hypothetical protein K491DRAFT_713172 [Lophiostoma macrostomum CBS 122681]
MVDPIYERLMQLMDVSAILPPQDRTQLANNLCFLLRRRYKNPIDPLDVSMILGKNRVDQFQMRVMCRGDTVIMGAPRGSREAALGGLRVEVESRIGEMSV